MKYIIKIKLLISSLLIFINITIYNFSIIPLDILLKNDSQILYEKICDQIPFKISPFQIAPSFPNQGTFKELFVLYIPNGMVKGIGGHILINNNFIKELVWGDNFSLIPPNTQENNSNPLYINGKVAVISQIGAGNYGHWIQEILGRLSILEMNNIKYDWIYISYDKPYIKKILKLWGIDESKIISPSNDNFTIKAETLIIPSLVIRTDQGHKQAGNFIHPNTMTYTRNKLIEKAMLDNIDTSNFSKKIFISRMDNYNARKIINEDEVFLLFEKKGFKRYILSNLTLTEQILLFNNADIVVGEHGAGLSNILFCKPGTQVIELFHDFVAMDFWYSSSLFNLKYIPVNTMLINADFYKDCHQNNLRLARGWSYKAHIPLDQIYSLIENL